jgi:hypothetical protein
VVKKPSSHEDTKEYIVANRALFKVGIGIGIDFVFDIFAEDVQLLTTICHSHTPFDTDTDTEKEYKMACKKMRPKLVTRTSYLQR